MADLGLETTSKKCYKCRWCAKYDDYNVLANTHTPVYYCTVGDFYSKTKSEMKPRPGDACPCFAEIYKDEGEC